MKPRLAFLLLRSCLMGVMAACSCVKFDFINTSDGAYRKALELKAAGKYSMAERSLEKLIRGRSITLGSDAPETLHAKLTLAGLLTFMQKNAEAEIQLRELLPVIVRVLGAEHADALTCQAALYTAMLGQGKYVGVESRLRRLIPVLEKRRFAVLGG